MCTINGQGSNPLPADGSGCLDKVRFIKAIKEGETSVRHDVNAANLEFGNYFQH